LSNETDQLQFVITFFFSAWLFR